MSVLDISIVLGIAFFVVLGFRDGFFKKIYGIVGFWAGLILAAKCMYFVGQNIADVFHFSKETSHIYAFCIVFLIVVLLENLFYRWFGTTGDKVLTFWSRMGGVCIGFLQGLVGVSLILVMFSIVNLPPEKSKSESRLYGSMLSFAPTAFDISTGWAGDSKGFLDLLQENFHATKKP